MEFTIQEYLHQALPGSWKLLATSIMQNSRFGPGLQGDASHRDLPLHKRRGRLVVDRGKGGDVADELVQQSRLQQVCLL